MLVPNAFQSLSINEIIQQNRIELSKQQQNFSPNIIRMIELVDNHLIKLYSDADNLFEQPEKKKEDQNLEKESIQEESAEESLKKRKIFLKNSFDKYLQSFINNLTDLENFFNLSEFFSSNSFSPILASVQTFLKEEKKNQSSIIFQDNLLNLLNNFKADIQKVQKQLNSLKKVLLEKSNLNFLSTIEIKEKISSVNKEIQEDNLLFSLIIDLQEEVLKKEAKINPEKDSFNPDQINQFFQILQSQSKNQSSSDEPFDSDSLDSNSLNPIAIILQIINGQ